MQEVVQVLREFAELLLADLELRVELPREFDRADLIAPTVGHQQSEITVEVGVQ